MEQTDPPAKVASNEGFGVNHVRAVHGLQALRVVLGIDSPETRGWAPAVQQEARRAIDRAVVALADVAVTHKALVLEVQQHKRCHAEVLRLAARLREIDPAFQVPMVLAKVTPNVRANRPGRAARR